MFFHLKDIALTLQKLFAELSVRCTCKDGKNLKDLNCNDSVNFLQPSQYDDGFVLKIQLKELMRKMKLLKLVSLVSDKNVG